MDNDPQHQDPTRVAAQPHGIKRDPLPPSLWNPIAIGLWSILFTPIFGAILQILNWKAIGNEVDARISGYWLYGLIAYYATMAVAPLISPAFSEMAEAGIGMSFLVLVVWNMTAGKAQYRYVSQHFGKFYRRRGWLVPLVIAAMALTAFSLTIESLAVALHGETMAVPAKQEP